MGMWYRGGALLSSTLRGIKRLVVLGEDGRHHVLRPGPVESTTSRIQVAGICCDVKLHQREHSSAAVDRGREGRSLEPPPGRVVVKPQASAVQGAAEIKVHRRHHESFDVRVRVLHARLCVSGPPRRGRHDAQEGEHARYSRRPVAELANNVPCFPSLYEWF